MKKQNQIKRYILSIAFTILTGTVFAQLPPGIQPATQPKVTAPIVPLNLSSLPSNAQPLFVNYFKVPNKPTPLGKCTYGCVANAVINVAFIGKNNDPINFLSSTMMSDKLNFGYDGTTHNNNLFADLVNLVNDAQGYGCSDCTKIPSSLLIDAVTGKTVLTLSPPSSAVTKYIFSKVTFVNNCLYGVSDDNKAVITITFGSDAISG